MFLWKPPKNSWPPLIPCNKNMRYMFPSQQQKVASSQPIEFEYFSCFKPDEFSFISHLWRLACLYQSRLGRANEPPAQETKDLGWRLNGRATSSKFLVKTVENGWKWSTLGESILILHFCVVAIFILPFLRNLTICAPWALQAASPRTEINIVSL